MARNLPGVITNKPDIGVCMVADCHRKALYRGASSRNHHTLRGYCSEHRHLGVPAIQQSRYESTFKHTDRYLNEWVPVVNDDECEDQ